MRKDTSNNIKAKTAVKRILLTGFSILGYLILAPVLARFLWGKNSWRILRYHSVSDHRRHETNVRADEFRTQMSFLKNNYNVLSLNNGCEYISTNNDIKNNCISITFDDGYM
ncbi:hypothetical protein ACFLQ8_02955, partial [Candidatus Auribacterota bacterium]